MNILKSKSFTLRFVLYRTIPGLAFAALTLIWPEMWIYCVAAILCFSGAIWSLVDARKLPILLAALILAPPARAQEPPKNLGGCIAVVVVIGIGGWCYYKMVKACQNLKPRVLPDDDESTNGAPKDFSAPIVAISQDLPPQYCCAGEEKSGARETTMELELNAGRLRILPGHKSDVVPAADFNQALARLGLNPAQSGAQYSTKDSPIAFEETGVVIRGENPRTIVLQKSDDLQSWQDLARITAPTRMRLRFTDATIEGSARFYRIATK